MSEPWLIHAQRQVKKAARSIIRHKPKLEFIEWAERYIRNPDGTAFKFRPYQIQPAKDLFNSKLEMVAIKMFSGAGKTYLIGAAIDYGVHEMRQQIGVMFPNVNLAEEYVTMELEEFFLNSPVKNLKRHKDIARIKKWENGARLDGLGADSAGKLPRLQAGILSAEEVDAISQESGDEGDKLAFFFSRGRERRQVYKWANSYPSIKGDSKIDSLYEQSDRCQWYVDCVHCGHTYVMHRLQMEWERGNPKSAVLICPSCNGTITDKQRWKMSWNGRY